MNTKTRYSPEIRERAVRLVCEHQAEYTSQWAAIGSIAEKIGCTEETLRTWVRRAERNDGSREGLSSDEHERLKALVERKNREPRRANEILARRRLFLPRRNHRLNAVRTPPSIRRVPMVDAGDGDAAREAGDTGLIVSPLRGRRSHSGGTRYRPTGESILSDYAL